MADASNSEEKKYFDDSALLKSVNPTKRSKKNLKTEEADCANEMTLSREQLIKLYNNSGVEYNG